MMRYPLGGFVNIEAAISLNSVTAGYPNRDVLRNVSLTIETGLVTAIVGPNGSGKSTLLKAVTGVINRNKGEINIGGKSLERVKRKDIAKLISVVEQSTDVGYDFTVKELVTLGRLPYMKLLAREGEADRRMVEEAMVSTGVAHLATKSVRALSGGERQRVIIARALAQSASILLLDEPTSHLDIGYQLEIMELVVRLARQKRLTVVAVLHDLNLASQYCDRLLVMSNGEVAACGRPIEILTEELIYKVYGVHARVKKHPETGLPYIMSMTKASLAPEPSRDSSEHVHVICGGGSGISCLRSLCKAGYRVTAGVLGMLDSDTEECDVLGVSYAADAPFSPISDSAVEECMELAKSAKVVVICPVPFGPGNLRNVTIAKRLALAGSKVVMMKASQECRDYTGGEAEVALLQLKSSGAFEVDGVDELINTISIIL